MKYQETFCDVSYFLDRKADIVLFIEKKLKGKNRMSLTNAIFEIFVNFFRKFTKVFFHFHFLTQKLRKPFVYFVNLH